MAGYIGGKGLPEQRNNESGRMKFQRFIYMAAVPAILLICLIVLNVLYNAGIRLPGLWLNLSLTGLIFSVYIGGRYQG